MTATDEALVATVARAICTATYGVCNVQDWAIEVRDNPNIEMCWNQALAAIAAMPPAPQWRTIDSAPRDGSEVLLLIENRAFQAAWDDCTLPNGSRYCPGEWRPASLPSHGCGCCSSKDPDPTHWMPIPTPPAGDER